MKLFHVAMCRPDQKTLYREFWEGKEPSQEASDAMDRGELGQSQTIEAKDLKSALKLAAEKRPDIFIIDRYSHEVGH